MADIVQLVENGVNKYIKTHAQAVEGLEEAIKPKSTILYKGNGMYFDETQGFDIDLAKINEGVHLVFSFYVAGEGQKDQQFQSFFISKETIENQTGSFICLVGNGGSLSTRKYVILGKKRLSGEATNKNDLQKNYVLRLAYYI